MSEPREIKVNGPQFTFGALVWGPVDGPLALCLHGYPDTAHTWRHLGPYLAAEGWRVVAPFTRGYAPTDLAPDGSYQIGALVRDAEDLHAALGGDKRAVLIGHDWGAITANATGSHRPDLFARIVVMAVPPAPVLFAVPRSLAHVRLLLLQLRCSWYIFFQQLPALPDRLLHRVIRRLWADWSPGYEASEDLRHVTHALHSRGRRTAALRYYRAFAQPWYRRRSYAAEQKHWRGVPRVPVLYLHGAQDGCMLADLAADVVRVLPPGSAAHTVPNTGHFLQLEDPATVNALIGTFIAGS